MPGKARHRGGSEIILGMEIAEIRYRERLLPRDERP
jgi:hypothetical protein